MCRRPRELGRDGGVFARRWRLAVLPRSGTRSAGAACLRLRQLRPGSSRASGAGREGGGTHTHTDTTPTTTGLTRPRRDGAGAAAAAAWRNFPGTASCDRTRSGASTVIAASRGRRTEPPPLSRRGSGRLTLLRTARFPHPTLPFLLLSPRSRGRRAASRWLPVMLQIEAAMAGGSVSFPVEHVMVGICSRLLLNASRRGWTMRF
ncbi:uncharacterized protein LOC115336059 isoform X4 [Aquila chrysaetos chrysaetos]|uniref:uncharacterized protein LOC115336059 isoform X4 n=1 Tax=Aquila chrysaetos chrysaetos TaxID=223781 RepID=UPI001177315C|nr:uncharacterized protein LOC115336059 isoform X4 [Aquila chrysaetos chrysaetos]